MLVTTGSDALLLDLSTGTFTDLPSLPDEDLRGHSCGYVEELNGVIMAGGLADETATLIWDIGNGHNRHKRVGRN